MQEKQDNTIKSRTKTVYSMQQKNEYCLAWQQSGMSPIAFCRAHGITKSAFYQWIKRFAPALQDKGFAPLVATTSATIAEQTEEIALTICLVNNIEVKLSLAKQRLVNFIKELSYAPTTLR